MDPNQMKKIGIVVGGVVLALGAIAAILITTNRRLARPQDDAFSGRFATEFDPKQDIQEPDPFEIPETPPPSPPEPIIEDIPIEPIPEPEPIIEPEPPIEEPAIEKPVDPTIPTTPQNLIITGSTFNSISMIWDPSQDDVAVTYYHVYRDGIHAATTTEPTYEDGGLLSEAVYTYTVRAQDRDENFSGFSNEATDTTTAVPEEILNPNPLLEEGIDEQPLDETNPETVNQTDSEEPVVIDPIVPSVTDGLIVESPTITSLDLDWSGLANGVGASTYWIIRDGFIIAELSTTSYTDDHLSANRTYTYVIQARDADGNTLIESAAVSGTTLPFTEQEDIFL